MLEFTYNNGRGRVQLNLEMILPCSAADMKRIMSFVDLSNNPDEHAKTVYDFIADRVAELKKEREKYDENSGIGKEKITKINAVMKKYLANAAALVKRYGLPELSDNAAQVVLHAATVYGVIYNSSTSPDACEWSAQPFDGWTFEKGGFIFDVRREKYARKTVYIIMLHGTGAECARAEKKSGIVAEITPRLLDVLKNGADKIAECKERYNKLMIDAGYMEPERRETISHSNTTETETEESTMSDFTFTANTMTCKGKTFSAEYNIIADGSVLVFAIINVKENGRKEKQRIHFKPEHPDYPAALEAAKAFKASSDECREIISTGFVKKTTPAGNVIEKAPAADDVREETAKAFENIPVIDTATGKTITENAAEIVDEIAAETVQEEKPAADPKAARGPVPEKTFVGEIIQGNGWKIIFDGETSRTRIIFDELPTDAAKEALREAGFYYSVNMDSWNKKLTFKAYRAAKAISGKLSELYAA